MHEQKSSVESENSHENKPDNINKKFIPSSVTNDIILRNICRREDFKKYSRRKRFNSCRLHLSRNENKRPSQSPVAHIRNIFGSNVANDVHLCSKNDCILNLSSLSISGDTSAYCSARNPVDIPNSVGDYHKFLGPTRNVVSPLSSERQSEFTNVLDKNVLAVRILNNLISSILPSNDPTAYKLKAGFIDESYKVSITEIRDILLIISKKISELQELDSALCTNYLSGLGDLSKSIDCQPLESDCDIIKLINDIYASKLDFHFSNLSKNNSPLNPSKSTLMILDSKKRTKQCKFCKTRIAPKFIKVRKSNRQKISKKRFVGLGKNKYQQQSFLQNSGMWTHKDARLFRSYKDEMEFKEPKKRSLLNMKHSIRRALLAERNLSKVHEELERTFQKTAKLLKLNRMKYPNSGQQVTCEERNDVDSKQTACNTIWWQPVENEVNEHDGSEESTYNPQSFSGNNNMVQIPKEPRTFLNNHKPFASCRRKTISHFSWSRKIAAKSTNRKNDKDVSKATAKEMPVEKAKTNFVIKNQIKNTRRSLMKQTSPVTSHKSADETYKWTVIYDRSMPNIR